DIGADHESRRPNQGKCRQRGLARSCRDVKDAVSRGHLGSSQHSWHEEARPIPGVPVVRGAVDMLSNCRVKSWSEVHARWRLTVFWCIHTPLPSCTPRGALIDRDKDRAKWGAVEALGLMSFAGSVLDEQHFTGPEHTGLAVACRKFGVPFEDCDIHRPRGVVP